MTNRLTVVNFQQNATSNKLGFPSSESHFLKQKSSTFAQKERLKFPGQICNTFKPCCILYLQRVILLHLSMQHQDHPVLSSTLNVGPGKLYIQAVTQVPIINKRITIINHIGKQS